ncbi:uncharacterized protein LOC134282321 [Saccostrea cucullata]|uniref:uncharacterized protein LOC134282321 n=1 Tax=Saccostrea cuccullata TaxID=36930 RepID=UPI002ED0AB59
MDSWTEAGQNLIRKAHLSLRLSSEEISPDATSTPSNSLPLNLINTVTELTNKSPPIATSLATTPSSSDLPTLFDRTPRTIRASAIERQIFTHLEEIKVRVNLNTKLLHALLRKVDNVCTVGEEGDESQDSYFPLSTRDGIEALENKLEERDGLSANLVKVLGGIGGDSLKSTVRRLLKYMIENDLAKQINWLGKGGKLAFSSLKVKEILIKGVRRDRLCSSATEAEVCHTAKEWFRYATDREGGRKRREDRKKAAAREVEQAEGDQRDDS